MSWPKSPPTPELIGSEVTSHETHGALFTELALYADPALVPNFDQETLGDMNQQFKDLIALTQDKNFLPRTAVSLSATRERYLKERISVWETLGHIQEFASNAADPKFLEKQREAEVTLTEKDLNDAIGRPGKSSYYYSGGAVYTPMQYVKMWLRDNGLGDGGSYSEDRTLYKEIVSAFTEWADAHKQPILASAADRIHSLDVVNPDIDLAPIAEKIQRKFVSEHIFGYDDVFRQGLQQGIVDVRAMKAFDRNFAEPRGIRRYARIALHSDVSSTTNRADLPSEDYRALSGFYSHSAKITSLNEQVNSAETALPFNEEFDRISGYSGFQSYCMKIRQEARNSLFEALSPVQVETFLSQFDDRVDRLWQARFTYHRPTGASARTSTTYDERPTDDKTRGSYGHWRPPTQAAQAEANDSSRRPKSTPSNNMRLEKTMFSDTIHIPLERTQDVDRLVEEDNATEAIERAFCQAAERHWGQAYDRVVIRSLVTAMISQAHRNPEQFIPAKAFRRVYREFHTDQTIHAAMSAEQKNVAEALSKQVGMLYGLLDIDDGSFEVTYNDGTLSLVVAEV